MQRKTAKYLTTLTIVALASATLTLTAAADLTVGPIACAELPHRVPFGFHGNWKYND